MSRGLAIVRAAAVPVVGTARVAVRTGMAIIAAQHKQPSLVAETRAFVRQGREDLLATIMGPLAGVHREMGAPGSPTSQQVTQGLEGRAVSVRDDRIIQRQMERG